MKAHYALFTPLKSDNIDAILRREDKTGNSINIFDGSSEIETLLGSFFLIRNFSRKFAEVDRNH